MHHRALCPTVLAALVACLATTATAAPQTMVPDERLCIVEERVVGCPSGDPISACPTRPLAGPGFTVRLRDVFNAPVRFLITRLHFTDPATVLYEDLRPGTTLDCIDRSFLRVTDADGWVTFAPRIGGTTATSTAQVTALGVLLGTVPVVSTDLDGDGLTGITDFTTFAANYLGHSPDRRTDYDGCTDPEAGATTLIDLVIFSSQYGRPMPEGICY